MKVLLVNNHFSNNGGADAYAYAIGKLLEQKGHNPIYFASSHKPYIFTSE